MKDRLSDDCLILLDDASRASEQAIVQRWAEEAQCQVSLHGDLQPAEPVLRYAHDRPGDSLMTWAITLSPATAPVPQRVGKPEEPAKRIIGP
jgi:hypothetical protein